MSLTGLMRTGAEVRRATPEVLDTGEVTLTWETAGEVRCAVVRAEGGVARGASGELVRVDAVAYLPRGAELRPASPGETPDRLVTADATYEVVFVDAGSGPRSPVRAGLRALREEA